MASKLSATAASTARTYFCRVSIMSAMASQAFMVPSKVSAVSFVASENADWIASASTSVPSDPAGIGAPARIC